MKFSKKEVNPFLIQYKLEGKEDKFARLSMYNQILFFNMNYLMSKKPKTIIIINECNTGGLIIASERYIDKTIEVFSKKQNKKIDFTKRFTNKINKLVYCSFRMED